MSERSGTEASGPGGSPRPSKRADPIGSYVTAGLVGVAILYFFNEARQLPSDIQRWPFWLCITGFVLLAVYALQQFALRRELGIVEKLDQATRANDPDRQQASVTAALEGSVRQTGDEDAGAALQAESERDTSAYGNPEDYSRRGNLMTLGASVLFVLFALAAYGFGFFPAALVFVPVYMLVNGERHVGKLVGVTLGTLVFVYGLFGFVLNTPLTRGEWFRPDWMLDWIPW
jgi:hypothetical protein